MSQIHKHSIPANIADSCLINPEQYKAQYHQSVTDRMRSGVSKAKSLTGCGPIRA